MKKLKPLKCHPPKSQRASHSSTTSDTSTAGPRWSAGRRRAEVWVFCSLFGALRMGLEKAHVCWWVSGRRRSPGGVPRTLPFGVKGIEGAGMEKWVLMGEPSQIHCPQALGSIQPQLERGLPVRVPQPQPSGPGLPHPQPPHVSSVALSEERRGEGWVRAAAPLPLH